tara:strand:- start:110 stop:340 length:231 start_codon:yes stop_codon:yes gene_type:complete
LRVSVGLVQHRAKSGKFIIKTNASFKKGTILTNRLGEELFKIVETIGPVKDPYVTATQMNDKADQFISKKVYFQGE